MKNMTIVIESFEASKTTFTIETREEKHIQAMNSHPPLPFLMRSSVMPGRRTVLTVLAFPSALLFMLDCLAFERLLEMLRRRSNLLSTFVSFTPGCFMPLGPPPPPPLLLLAVCLSEGFLALSESSPCALILEVSSGMVSAAVAIARCFGSWEGKSYDGSEGALTLGRRIVRPTVPADEVLARCFCGLSLAAGMFAVFRGRVFRSCSAAQRADMSFDTCDGSFTLGRFRAPVVVFGSDSMSLRACLETAIGILTLVRDLLAEYDRENSTSERLMDRGLCCGLCCGLCRGICCGLSTISACVVLAPRLAAASITLGRLMADAFATTGFVPPSAGVDFFAALEHKLVLTGVNVTIPAGVLAPLLSASAEGGSFPSCRSSFSTFGGTGSFGDAGLPRIPTVSSSATARSCLLESSRVSPSADFFSSMSDWLTIGGVALPSSFSLPPSSAMGSRRPLVKDAPCSSEMSFVIACARGFCMVLRRWSLGALRRMESACTLRAGEPFGDDFMRASNRSRLACESYEMLHELNHREVSYLSAVIEAEAVVFSSAFMFHLSIIIMIGW